jgi:F0F1-type ATP synthase assembly protein I
MPKWRDVLNQQDLRDMAYGCALSSQVGIAIAAPVLIGLFVGWQIDNALDSLPWITLVLTAIGAVLGPIIAYRWVTTAMRQRFAGRTPVEETEEVEDEDLN